MSEKEKMGLINNLIASHNEVYNTVNKLKFHKENRRNFDTQMIDFLDQQNKNILNTRIGYKFYRYEKPDRIIVYHTRAHQ